MIARIIIAGAVISAATAVSAQTPQPNVFDKEVNRGKDQIYYRVEFGTKAKMPSAGEIEAMCKSLDKGESKFVTFVHFVGQQKSAYANCSRLKDQPRDLEVKVF